MNIESMNLEAIINGGATHYGLIGSSSTGSGGSSSSGGSGSLGLLSSSGNSDSLSIDDLPFSTQLDSTGNVTTSSSTTSSSSASSNGVIVVTNGGDGHLQQQQQPNNHSHSIHHHNHQDLSDQLSQHFSSNTSSSVSNATGTVATFSLDQFDTIDAATSCQLLQSYNIIKDEEYALLDDEDLVGSLMIGGGLHHVTGVGVDPTMSAQTLTDHLTPAQFTLLEDCLDHITSSDGGGLSVSVASSSSISTIPTSTALNHISSSDSSAMHDNLNNLNHQHQNGHQDDVGYGQFDDHHSIMVGSFVDDCGDLVGDDELSEHLGSSLVSTTTVDGGVQSISQQQQQTGTINGNSTTIVVPQSMIATTEDLLTPIITTVSTSSGAAAIVATSTASPISVGNIGQLTNGGQHLHHHHQQQQQQPTITIKPTNGKNGQLISTSSIASSSKKNKSASNTSKTVVTTVVTTTPTSKTSVNSTTHTTSKSANAGGSNRTRNCYCLLCSRFLEDLGEFFGHLKSDHQLLKQPEPVNTLYVRHVFKTFEDFMRWKSQELEVQTGCTYERCFTNEYSRSIYYKCAAIRINRITLTGKQTTSSKEPASIEPGGSHHPSIPKNSNSNNATPTVNGNGDPNSAEKVSAPPPPAPPQGDMILESSFDARMYPCTSSIRLVFRYTGIEAIEFPFHLGHKLDSNIRDLCLSQVHNTPQQSSFPHQVPKPVTNSVIGQQHPSQQITATQAQHHSGVKYQSPIKTEQMLASASPTIARTTTTSGNQQITTFVTTTKPAGPIQQQQSNRILHNNNINSSTTNSSTTTTTHAPPSAVNTPTTANTPVSGTKPKRKRARDRDQKTGELVAATSNKVLVTTATVTSPQPVSTPQPQPPSASSSSLSTSAKLNASIINKSIQSGTPLAKTIKLEPVETKPIGTTLVANLPQLNLQGGNLNHSHLHQQQQQQHHHPHLGNVQPLAVATSGTSAIMIIGQSLPTSSSANSGTGITQSSKLTFNDPSYTDEPPIRRIKFDDSSAQQNQEQQTGDDPSMVALMNSLSNNNVNEMDSSVKMGSIDVKDGSIITANAAPISTTSQPASSTLDSSTDDNLVIVPLEKGVQIVEESIRPRKEQLRKRFNDLLDTCLTEADIELVETSIESMISANLLQ
ncbi:hypothetical protein BLOT_014307 [Blomia tropicalis]|nr:hypothetical protein BLOT_014307 [Blomia tropicalis]